MPSEKKPPVILSTPVRAPHITYSPMTTPTQESLGFNQTPVQRKEASFYGLPNIQTVAEIANQPGKNGLN
jgi:hypothetical protein